MTFETVAKTGDLAPGESKVIEAGGKTIALFNIGGSFHAIENACAHKGGPLGEGTCEGNTVTCPWHGWQYNVESGESTSHEGVSVGKFEVKVEGDEIKVDVV